MLGVISMTFQDHPDRHNSICTALARKLAHDNRDLKRARHLVQHDIRRWGTRTEFGGGMVNQTLHVLRVVLARNNGEIPCRDYDTRRGRSQLRHEKYSAADPQSRWPIFSRFVLR